MMRCLPAALSCTSSTGCCYPRPCQTSLTLPGARQWATSVAALPPRLPPPQLPEARLPRARHLAQALCCALEACRPVPPLPKMIVRLSTADGSCSGPLICGQLSGLCAGLPAVLPRRLLNLFAIQPAHLPSPVPPHLSRFAAIMYPVALTTCLPHSPQTPMCLPAVCCSLAP